VQTGTARVIDPSARLRREFGRSLRQARIAAGLTQGQVAAATGINIGHISEVERGLQNITLNTMTALAKSVGMDVEIGLKPVSRRRKRPT
jgi:transcriptional regulator with XRE-family HTH domain